MKKVNIIIVALIIMSCLSGFSQGKRKNPYEILDGDKKLLASYEKAKTFDTLYFKDVYQDQYEVFKKLIKEESFLVDNYYRRVAKFQEAKFFKKKKRQEGLLATEALNSFYSDKLLPNMDSIKVCYGKFRTQEKQRKKLLGIHDD